jgi:hypothetical protein
MLALAEELQNISLAGGTASNSEYLLGGLLLRFLPGWAPPLVASFESDLGRMRFAANL